MYTRLSLLLALSLQLACAHASTREPARTEDTTRAALLLDVRTPEEHAQGHLPGDLLVPLPELEARMSEVEQAVNNDKTQKVVVYCHSGRRAGEAKVLLEQHGFSQVVNGGGYDDLK